jgi:hypothetical protein
VTDVKQGTGRPTKGYFTEDGKRVPSVTTITGRFKDSGGLIHWAWQQGIDGINYRESRDKAADAGSFCHRWIEDWIHGRESNFEPVWETDDDTIVQARTGFSAFQEWADSVELEVLETEFPLVSETYKFGGTPDALALVAGKPKLLDWKSSNAVYVEYVAQVAAYRQLIRERATDLHWADILGNYPHAPDSALLLRIGKEHADFHLHSYPSSVLDLGWEYFQHALSMFSLDKELKKVAA